MFERRIRFLLSLFAVALVVMVLRLVDLQVLHGAYYTDRAKRSLTHKPKSLPFVRGKILDRYGEGLVAEEPCWDITVDYAALAADAETYRALSHIDDGSAKADEPAKAVDTFVARWKRHETSLLVLENPRRALLDELATMWRDMTDYLAKEGLAIELEELRNRARKIDARVQRVRHAVAQRRGFDGPVAEENEAHTIVGQLSYEEQMRARDALSRYPWVHFEPSTVRRVANEGEPFAHVVGRLGPVDAEVVENDPNADDPFARYRADERLGISGVEYLAEPRLRGRRGQIMANREGTEVETIEAEHGQDVVLTLDATLQRRLYDRLAETVAGVPDSSGGAIVVLDVASRDVLALVSYPSYDPNRFDEVYSELRNDTQRLPLRFRAVANRYAPGSTVKPLICITGLSRHKITVSSREECTGYLFPQYRDRWRCWEAHGTGVRVAHGFVNVTEALTGSCNVFMYRLGEKLGIDGLCGAFDSVGVGRGSGLGLLEENPGINPTPGWLMRNKNTPAGKGHERNFAIGQGEVSMTPVQVANLMATYASGKYRPATLVRNGKVKPTWNLPGTAEQWRAVRLGIFGVTNDSKGTAYKYAHFVRDGYALAGKTGSATAFRWPTGYRVPYVDANGDVQEAFVPAGAKKQAIQRFEREHPHATFDPDDVEVATRWPPYPSPEGSRFSHAWIGAYLQAVDPLGRPDWSRTPRLAYAVLVEFGGSGGRTAGPLAVSVAEELLDRYGPNLNPNVPVQ